MSKKSAYTAINQEINQDHIFRKPLLQKLVNLMNGRNVVSFFISFGTDSPLSQQDADMIEETLCTTDSSKGITLILDAPGGDGLAAERIIQICKSYSKTDFWTIVPARAKSAATMVCLGSDKIMMSPTSELGPIDPQVPMKLRSEHFEWVAAHHVVKTYDDLLGKAVALAAGHIEPYLQQLSNFNAVHIEQLRSAQKLAEHIAVRSLKNGMLKTRTEAKIKALIKPFTDPEITMAHGRAVNFSSCKECKLNVELIDLESELWNTIWQLYTRSKFFVSTKASKLLETVNSGYVQPMTA